MMIQKMERKNEKGELEVTFKLTEEQTQVLLEFAINFLLGQGLVTMTEQAVQSSENNKPEEITLEDAMMDVMKEAKPADLPQA